MNPRTPQWTATDLTDAQLAELGERQRRGEVRVWGWGVGSSNGTWCAAYVEAKPPAQPASVAGSWRPSRLFPTTTTKGTK